MVSKTIHPGQSHRRNVNFIISIIINMIVLHDMINAKIMWHLYWNKIKRDYEFWTCWMKWVERLTNLFIGFSKFITVYLLFIFPIVVIFFRGCVSEMVVLSYSVIYYIYNPGTLGPCFHYWCSVYGICKWSNTLWPAGRVRLFANYTILVSSLYRLIWRHWTTKMLVRYMMPSVCLRLRQFSQLSFIQYMGLCVFSLPNSPVMIVRMCTLSYHHQTGSMNH